MLGEPRQRMCEEEKNWKRNTEAKFETRLEYGAPSETRTQKQQ